MLVRYLYLKGLVLHNFTYVSRSMFSLATLFHVNDTDLNVLVFSNKPFFEVITESQNLINALNLALKASGGDLKLEIFFWTLQEHSWNNHKCTLEKSTPIK